MKKIAFLGQISAKMWFLFEKHRKSFEIKENNYKTYENEAKFNFLLFSPIKISKKIKMYLNQE